MYIETGIRFARNYAKSVSLHVKEVAEETDKKREKVIYNSISPNPRQVQRFLLDNNYVVTITDKNLGAAVSDRDWLIQKTKDLLSDRRNYAPVHRMIVDSICSHQCNKMWELSLRVPSTIYAADQLMGFLRSKETPRDQKNTAKFVEEHHVPTFYGIPKIHKMPVKVRPIIPCHSAIQNPAAKFVSKTLKPIIQSEPTIIHGSKDLAIKLSKIQRELIPGHHWYLVSGDVVAFYPNIDLDKCIKICQTFILDALFEYATIEDPANAVSKLTTEDREFFDFFSDCIKVASKNLVFQFDSEYYKQLLGLAMGVACSPDMANLYGAYFERVIGILNDPAVVYYGRYIDDCLAIVYASSEEEALARVSKVKFDNCQIEWVVSFHRMPFLDMMLFKDEFNHLQWIPYRKDKNHHERIPWISAHPTIVKKGTFIGEISRLATLCSRKYDYVEQLKSLQALYISRGYPEALVRKWTKDNITKRWDTRQKAKAEDEEPSKLLVLKSEFNSAWDFFNAKEIENIMFNYWRTYMIKYDGGNLDGNIYPTPRLLDTDLGEPCHDSKLSVSTPLYYRIPDIRKTDILDSKVLVSKKRTRNLYDIASQWKKAVISRIDEAVLGDKIDDDIITPEVDQVDAVNVRERLVPGDLEYVHHRA